MIKPIKHYLEKIETLDNKVYDGLGILSQFTVDTVEHLRDELQSQSVSTTPLVSDETLIGSLIYELDTVSEVMDKMLPDYAVIQEAIEILQEKEDA
jgi:demethoxyubiquinone hydroxylase (CLK1/Coq7/Cat5 family)